MNRFKAALALLDMGRILGIKASPADAADALASELKDELQEAYDAWLFDLSQQLADEPDAGQRDALIIAAMALLIGAVRARSRARLNSLAVELNATAAQLAAMERELTNTLDIFEDRTAPSIQQQLMDNSHAVEPGAALDPAAFVESNAGLWARVALVAGILWTAYVAGRTEQYSGEVLARWIGPNDSDTCDPCNEQMGAGIRPLAQTPLPGPAVCLGLTNCRHDIEVQNPATGQWELA